jgi:predicted Rossmann fold flavoprotein
MKRIQTAIIGGGASGLVLAAALKQQNHQTVALFERGERLGKKLSATGNGQGNLTNRNLSAAAYFSRSKTPLTRVENVINAYDDESFCSFLKEMGLLCLTDERGRVYPSGRQASSITDALRFTVAQNGVQIYTQTQIIRLEKEKDEFLLTAADNTQYRAANVVLCTGGKAAKNFGTDGSAYALAQSFGHSVTALTPSLVQLKTQTQTIKTLKGIRITDGGLTADWSGGKQTLRGDIIFTDYGVSGDAVFRISAFVADKWEQGVTLYLDFLPDYTEEEIYNALQKTAEHFPALPFEERLGGIVNNQVGRAVLKTVKNGDNLAAAKAVKAFPLVVTGTLGFDYAQVTKGGIPLTETDETLQSVYEKGLYFAGEILDVDGACGGYNLQWAYASARIVADALNAK